MIRNICLFLARVFVQRSVTSGAAQMSGGRLDPKLGFRLLRDRRVPIAAKMAALALGVAAAGAMQIAEAPLELLLLMVPVLGVADVAADGLEIFAIMLGVASVALPFLIPRELLAKIRHEGDGRVFDAAPASSGRR